MKRELLAMGALITILFFTSLNFLVIEKGDNKSVLTPVLFEISVAAQTGTCCSETGSWCIIGAIEMADYYYKSSGSCKGDVEMAY